LLTEDTGAKDWQDLATVDEHPHGSFKEAAIVRGLVQDNDDHDKMLKSARFVCSSAQLHTLFALVLVWHEPRHPGELWMTWRDELTSTEPSRLVQRLF